MNRKTFVLALLLVVFVAIAAFAVMPAQTAQASSGGADLVRFTIDNRSSVYFILFLSGPEDYEIQVPPETIKSFAPVRGEYSYFMGACNFSDSGVLDLTAVHTMIIPVCGGRAASEARHPHTTDVSEKIRPIRITIQNKTKDANSLLLTNVDTRKSYWLQFDWGETQELIVLWGDYRYSYMACGEPQVGIYSARVYQPLVMRCTAKK